MELAEQQQCLYEGVKMAQRVLIIDDSKNIHALIKSRLEGEGLELHSCFNAEQGIATAGQLLPDLILVDWEMPEIDGSEICRRLKAQSATMTIPVVYLTGIGSPQDKLRGLDAGAVD